MDMAAISFSFAIIQDRDDEGEAPVKTCKFQVLDLMVARAAFGADYFDGGGVDNHAEARIVRGLEKNGPSTVPNGAAVGQHTGGGFQYQGERKKWLILSPASCLPSSSF
jgi:hypothetical protein